MNMLIGENQNWADGIEQAWEILTSLNPDDVCRNSKSSFDKLTEAYTLPLFNRNVYISLLERLIKGDSEASKIVLNELSHYSILAILWYLIKAKDIPTSGNLVKPGEVSGGLIFSQGSHILPLDKLIERYGDDLEEFTVNGIYLGGEKLRYGDAAVKLYPFPRVPISLIIWGEDEEFPARAEFLFDSTCSEHLPTDIPWATATMSILLMTSL